MFIYLLMDIWVTSSLRVLQIKLLWTFVKESLGEYVFSSLLGKSLRMEWLDCMVRYACLKNKQKLFYKVTVPFYVPIGCGGGWACNATSLWFQIVYPWCLMILSFLFIDYPYLLFDKVYFQIFKWVILLLRCKSSLYTLNTTSLSDIHFIHIFWSRWLIVSFA